MSERNLCRVLGGQMNLDAYRRNVQRQNEHDREADEPSEEDKQANQELFLYTAVVVDKVPDDEGRQQQVEG